MIHLPSLLPIFLLDIINYSLLLLCENVSPWTQGLSSPLCPVLGSGLGTGKVLDEYVLMNEQENKSWAASCVPRV
jgi:hypothetical protein